MLANIRSQPQKISPVLFDPPIAKASGAQYVRTQRITYRSATSKNSRISCHWMTMFTTMTMSQPALGSVSKVSSPNGSKVTASGTCSISMTVADRSKPIAQICRLTSSKKENIALRRNSRPGSFASMPTPEAMERIA